MFYPKKISLECFLVYFRFPFVRGLNTPAVVLGLRFSGRLKKETCIASNFRQFSTNTKIKIIKLIPVYPLGAKKNWF